MVAMFYGLYRSGVGGCRHQLASDARATLTFPVRVRVRCPLCRKEHDFTYVSAYSVTGPTQARSFARYCDKHHIERDIEI